MCLFFNLDALARTGLGNATDGGVCTAANTLDTTAHIHYPFSISNGFHACKFSFH
jgi:3-deoxy-D-arabino-heptulosonate 7-phosphate (DAHP) synthase